MTNEVQTVSPELQKSLDDVMVRMGVKWPFFCQMMAAQVLELNNSMPTMATDGHKVYINEKFFMEVLSDATRVGVMAHEIVHVCLEHPSRVGLRNRLIWNIAIDFVTNGLLVAEKFELPTPYRTFDSIMSPGAGALVDSRFDDMSEEQVYDYLMKNLPPEVTKDPEDGEEGVGEGTEPGGLQGDSPGKRQRGNGRPRPDMDDMMTPQGTPEQQAEQRRKTHTAIINAATMERAMGQGAGLGQRLAGRLTQPKERWYDRLRRYVTDLTFHNYNWNKINRRVLRTVGIIAPDMRDEVIRHLVIAVDLSGSITDAIVDYFASHMNKILDDCKPSKMSVMYFDDGVDRTDEYTVQDLPIKFVARGGGGTNFIPVFEEVAKLEQPPSALIFLTDTYGAFPQQAPDYPVIWASFIDNVEVPFGELVIIDDRH